MHVLNQIARTERLTLGDGRKKHISAHIPNNAYIFSVNSPSELIPNSFFMFNIPHINHLKLYVLLINFFKLNTEREKQKILSLYIFQKQEKKQ